MGELQELWVRTKVDGHVQLILVVAKDLKDAERHLVTALSRGARVHHQTPEGPMIIEWNRVATLQVLGAVPSARSSV
jgi:hypothetical protein